MRPCSGGRQYIPRSPPVPPFTALPQWMGTPIYHPLDVWGPCLPSSVPPGGETPQGISTTRGSLPMYRTQTESLLAPLPHKTSPPFSYLIPPLPRYPPSVPISPRPPEVQFHFQPIIFGGQQRLSQVSERRDPRQRCTIRQEYPLHPFHCLLSNQPLYFPLRPAPAHIWSWVRPIECLVWVKHVTLGGPGVGLIPLLQDYYAVPRVLVSKLYLEVCTWGLCTLEYLHREPQSGKDGRKGQPMPSWCPIPISTPPPLGQRWGFLAAPNYVLLLPMGREKLDLKVDSALREM